MAFDSSFISELKFKNPVDDIIGSHLQLKRAGGRFVACCPFHNEKTPSFTVFKDTESYYCFGCGAGGDVITFIMKYKNLDYREAVLELASRVGMSVPDDNDKTGQKKLARERMLEMHRLAARHYHKNLTDGDNECIKYVKSRGLDSASITRYGLGYAKDSFDDLKSLLLKNGYSLPEMYSAGLVAKSQKNGSYYDKFRDRLMFPVIDLRGNVIAFSGRALKKDALPKYMNSPDTVIYNKGNVVFGLNVAKDKCEGTLILCEGNIDVVMLSQAGFKNAIAPLGTAFTVEQARIIAKYAKNVVVAFDSDAAGQKATAKAIDFLKGQGVSVRVLQMQGAKDPDEFIKTYGKERFSMLIKRSKTPTEYALDKLAGEYNLDDTAQKMQFIQKACDTVAALDSAVEREIYTAKLSKMVDVTVNVLTTDIEKRHKQQLNRERKNQITNEIREITGMTDNVNRERGQNLLAARSEEMLITIIAKNPSLIEVAQQNISPEDFVTDFNRQVYEFYVNGLGSDKTVQSLSLSESFDAAQVSRITYLLNTTVLSGDAKTQLLDCISTIKSQKLKKVNPHELSPEQLAELIKKEK